MIRRLLFVVLLGWGACVRGEPIRPAPLDANREAAIGGLTGSQDQLIREGSVEWLRCAGSGRSIPRFLTLLEDGDAGIRYYSASGPARVTGRIPEWSVSLFREREPAILAYWRAWKVDRGVEPPAAIVAVPRAGDDG